MLEEEKKPGIIKKEIATGQVKITQKKPSENLEKQLKITQSQSGTSSDTDKKQEDK